MQCEKGGNIEFVLQINLTLQHPKVIMSCVTRKKGQHHVS